MDLKVIGSSSAGNCYILTDKGGNSLIIELGVNFKEVQKSLNFDLSKCVGAIVTHEHGDHSVGIKNALNYMNVYATKGTFEGCNVDVSGNNVNVIKYFEWFKVGDFTITSFDIDHDVNEPCGFVIYHPDSGYILFLTDTTYLKYNFEGVKFSTLLIEANYCEDILMRNSHYQEFLKRRVVKNHMSLRNTILTINRTDTSELENIILIHLSDSNSEDQYFINEVSKNIGRPTYVAKKNSQFIISKL